VRYCYDCYWFVIDEGTELEGYSNHIMEIRCNKGYFHKKGYLSSTNEIDEFSHIVKSHTQMAEECKDFTIERPTRDLPLYQS